MTESETQPDAALPFSMRSVGGSTAVLGVGLIIGQFFGVVRSLFVAGAVGASSSFDAALVAIVLPTVLGNWISSTLRIVLVPAYRRVTHTSGEAEARRLIGTVLTYVSVASVVAVVVVLAIPNAVVTLSGPGLDTDTHQLAVQFLPLIAPMLAFLALANVLTAVFQIAHTFAAVAFAWAAGPVASLVTTIFLWDQIGMSAYVAGTTVGAFVTLAVLLVAGFYRRIIPRPSLTSERSEIVWFARRALPQTVASGVLQLNLISDRAIATLLSAGAASALKYGQQLVSEPAAALSTSWATAVYPAVVDAGGQRANPNLGDAMTTALRYTVAVFVPIAVGTIAFAPLVVNLVYGRGAFGAQDIAVTSAVVAAFAPTIVLSMAQPVFSAAHNARHRGSLMAIAGIANAILNVGLNVLFGAYLGVAGIALSTSVTMSALLVFLAWRVPSDEAFRGREVVVATGRSLLASLVPAIPIGLIVWSLPPAQSFSLEVSILLLLSALALMVYLLLAKVLGLNEPLVILSVIWQAISARASRLLRAVRGMS